jgi:hypothetical protein
MEAEDLKAFETWNASKVLAIENQLRGKAPLRPISAVGAGVTAILRACAMLVARLPLASSTQPEGSVIFLALDEKRAARLALIPKESLTVARVAARKAVRGRLVALPVGCSHSELTQRGCAS